MGTRKKIGAPLKGTGRRVTTSVTFDPELLAALDDYCKRNKINRSDYLNDVVITSLPGIQSQQPQQVTA